MADFNSSQGYTSRTDSSSIQYKAQRSVFEVLRLAIRGITVAIRGFFGFIKLIISQLLHPGL